LKNTKIQIDRIDKKWFKYNKMIIMIIINNKSSIVRVVFLYCNGCTGACLVSRFSYLLRGKYKKYLGREGGLVSVIDEITK
jgi:hypothetical protein